MKEAINILKSAKSAVIIQAENPDGDSLGSALALEHLLGEAGLEPTMYCAVDIPKYLRYLPGWDRVTNEAPQSFDVSVIVDASTAPLLEKTYAAFGQRLAKHPSIVIDHHETEVDLLHDVVLVSDKAAVASAQMVYQLAQTAGWQITADTANLLAAGIMSDTLGLSTPGVTAESIRVVADLVERGATLHTLDEARRELNTKSVEIFHYKGRLFERVELELDNQLAWVHIPWSEIEDYSDQYNPSMLIIDEMRLIEGVKVAIAFKSYPDGKVTAKIRTNSSAPIADQLAEHFGGGGHQHSAGFKRTDTPLETLQRETVTMVKQLLEGLV